MDLRGLINEIYNAVLDIDLGRKGFATRGKEQEGRISYEDGIARSMAAFQEAQASAHPQALILAEYTFISQEFQLCDKADKYTLNSLTQAIASFDDAFLSLKAVDEPSYKMTNNVFPHNEKYRVKGFPKDCLHIACIAHRTRLKNILRAPGIDKIEKDLLEQRLANLLTAQNSYIVRQKKVLESQID